MHATALLEVTEDGGLVVKVKMRPETDHEKQLMKAVVLVSKKQTVSLQCEDGKYVQSYWCFWRAH